MSQGDRGMEIRVGLLVTVCVALLVAFIVILGRVSTSSGSPIHLDVDTSASLKPGAPVKVAGVDAGKVSAVEYRGGEIDPAVGRPVFVRVTMNIHDHRLSTLNEHAEFFITTQGVLGEKYVEIQPSRREGRPLKAGQILEGEPPLRLEVMAMNANRVLNTLSDVLSRNEQAIDGIIKDAADTMVSVKAAAATIDGILGRNGERVDQAFVKFEAIEDEALTALRSVNEVLGDGSALRAVMRDAAALAADARNLIRPIAQDVRATLARYAKLGETAETSLSELKGEIETLLGKAGIVLDDAAALTAQLKDGRGTIGALLSDREMYDDVREMMKDLKRHPWKFIWKE